MNRGNSIQFRVIVLALVPMLASVLILSVFFITERIQDSEEALEKKAHAIINQLSSSSDYGLTTENHLALQQLADLALLDEDLISVEFIQERNNKKFLFKQLSSRTEEANSFPVTRYEGAIHRTTLQIDDFMFEENNYGDTIVGKVIITVSREDILNKQREIIANNLMLMLFFMIITSLLAIHFANEITSPILQLSRIVNSIKHGLFDINVDTGAKGEIAMLENGIKEMASSLLQAKNREKELLEEQLFIEKSRALTTLESIAEGVITTNSHGHITYINPSALRLLNSSLAHLSGKSIQKILNLRHPSSDARISYPVNDCLVSGNTITHDHPLILIDTQGIRHFISDNCSPLYDRTGNTSGVILTLKELSQSSLRGDTGRLKSEQWLYNSSEVFCRDVDFHRSSTSELQHSLCLIRFSGTASTDSELLTSRLHSLTRSNDLLLIHEDSPPVIIIFLHKSPAQFHDIIKKRFMDAFSHNEITHQPECYFIELDNELIGSNVYIDSLLQMNSQSVVSTIDNNRTVTGQLQYETSRTLPRLIYRQLLANTDNSVSTSHVIIDLDEKFHANYETDIHVANKAIEYLKNHPNLHALFIPVSSHTLLNQEKLKSFIYHLIASGYPLHKLSIIIDSQIASYDSYAFHHVIKNIRNAGCRIALGQFNTSHTGLSVLSEYNIDYIIIDMDIVSKIDNSDYMSILQAISHVARHTNTISIAHGIKNNETQKQLERSDVDYFSTINPVGKTNA